MANNYDSLSDAELDQLVAQKLSAPKEQRTPAVNYNDLNDDDLDRLVAEKLAQRNPSQYSVSNLAPDAGVIAEGQPVQAPQAQPVQKSLGDQLQTQLESFGNTVSMGHLPQIQAIFEKYLSPDATAAVDEELRAKGFDIPKREYVDMRDENISRQDGQVQRNPESAITGSIAGIAAQAPMMAASAGTQALGGLARLRNAAGIGFGFGAAQNPGDVAGVVSPLQGAERLKGGGTGAAIGGAGQVVGDTVAKVGNAVKNSPNTLEKLAKVKAFKAAGAMLKDFRSARGDKAAEEVGETLLKKNIVAAGDGVEEIAAKTSAAKNEAGQKIKSIYAQVKKYVVDYQDDVIEGLKPRERKLLEMTKLDGKVMSAKIRSRLDGYQKNNLGNTEVKGKMDEILADLESMGDDIDLGDLLTARNSLDDRINYAKKVNELPLLQKQMSTARQEITKMIQDRVRAVGVVIKDKNLIKELKNANKEYGQLSTVERFANDKIARENANRFYSLGDRLSGSAGATVGALSGDSPEERIRNGLMGYAGAKVAAKYGRHSTAMAAVGAKKLGEALKKPAAFAKFGEPLIEAAKKSPEEFQALLNSFAQNPEFQKLGAK